MLAVGHAVELQHSDAAIAGLLYGTLKIRQRPLGPRVAGGGNQQRMVGARLEGEAEPCLVGKLRLAAPAGELEAELLE
jgi:hypothetical protein